jgi:hypothetical protein
MIAPVLFLVSRLWQSNSISQLTTDHSPLTASIFEVKRRQVFEMPVQFYFFFQAFHFGH